MDRLWAFGTGLPWTDSKWLSTPFSEVPKRSPEEKDYTGCWSSENRTAGFLVGVCVYGMHVLYVCVVYVWCECMCMMYVHGVWVLWGVCVYGVWCGVCVCMCVCVYGVHVWYVCVVYILYECVCMMYVYGMWVLWGVCVYGVVCVCACVCMCVFVCVWCVCWEWW